MVNRRWLVCLMVFHTPFRTEGGQNCTRLLIQNSKILKLILMKVVKVVL